MTKNSVNKKEFSKESKNILVLILGILGVLIILLGASYALLELTLPGEKEHVINVGDLSVTIENEANEIVLTDVYPVDDEEGITYTPYTFTVKNNGTESISYSVKIIDDNEKYSTCNDCKILPADGIRYQLAKTSSSTVVANLSETRVIDNNTLGPNESCDYELRLWIDNTRALGIEYQWATFYGKIEVEATQIRTTN